MKTADAKIILHQFSEFFDNDPRFVNPETHSHEEIVEIFLAERSSDALPVLE